SAGGEHVARDLPAQIFAAMSRLRIGRLIETLGEISVERRLLSGEKRGEDFVSRGGYGSVERSAMARDVMGKQRLVMPGDRLDGIKDSGLNDGHVPRSPGGPAVGAVGGQGSPGDLVPLNDEVAGEKRTLLER